MFSTSAIPVTKYGHANKARISSTQLLPFSFFNFMPLEFVLFFRALIFTRISVTCILESSSQAEKTIEFLPPSSHSATETAAGKLERYPPQSPNLKEQELSSERPFRLRLNLQQEENRLTPAARGLISLRSSEHNVSDVVSALPRPNSAISIPSKCKYVAILLLTARSQLRAEQNRID